MATKGVILPNQLGLDYEKIDEILSAYENIYDGAVVLLAAISNVNLDTYISYNEQLARADVLATTVVTRKLYETIPDTVNQVTPFRIEFLKDKKNSFLIRDAPLTSSNTYSDSNKILVPDVNGVLTFINPVDRNGGSWSFQIDDQKKTLIGLGYTNQYGVLSRFTANPGGDAPGQTAVFNYSGTLVYLPYVVKMSEWHERYVRKVNASESTSPWTTAQIILLSLVCVLAFILIIIFVVNRMRAYRRQRAVLVKAPASAPAGYTAVPTVQAPYPPPPMVG